MGLHCSKRTSFLSALICILLSEKIILIEGLKEGSNRTHESQLIINELLDGYDSGVPPKYDSGEPVISRTQIYLQGVYSVDVYSMDFSVSFILRQRWYDERLAFNSSNISHVELDINTMKKIWVPDAYIVNEKQADIHKVTMQNKLMHVYSDGKVVYSLRISGRYSCNMDLHKYPHDKQICKMFIESFGYSAETLVLRWQKKPVEMDKDMVLPQYDLDKISHFICDTTHAEVKYSCIGIAIHLSRTNGFYIIQVYIPSILIVSLSWFSFWLGTDAGPARISLGLLTVLTMTTQSSSARASLPRVSYVKAIDVWMSVCLMFVFLALIEFAYVNWWARRKKIKGNEDRKNKAPESEGKNYVQSRVKGSYLISRQWSEKEKAEILDKVSRILFPSVFAFFNIIYWVLYAA